MSSYKCEALVAGEVIDKENYYDYKNIMFRIGELDRFSYGSLEFNYPVNLSFIRDNWDGIFQVYVQNITYFDHNTPQTLDNFEIVNISADNKTLWFRCQFHDSYLLGLLVKRRDNLFIHLRYDLLDIEGFIKEEHAYYRDMFLGNTSLSRFYPDKCRKDKDGGDGWTENTENREMIFAAKRIDL
jgi:hypothetical protein